MASFVEVLGDRDRKDCQLVASGSVVELRYRQGAAVVSARAQKLYHLLIKGVGVALTTRVPFHSVPLASVRDLAHLSNADLKELAEELVGTIVEVKTLGPKGATAIGGLLSFVSIDHDAAGSLQFAFSEPMIRVFEVDNRWTVIDRETLLGFESKYAIRLYELLILRGGYYRREEDFTLGDIRDRLGVAPDKVKLFANFKSDILQPAIDEVHRRTGRLIEWKPIKAGRSVSRIVITWPVLPVEAGEVVIDAPADAPKLVREKPTKSKAKSSPVRPERVSAPVEPARVEPRPEQARSSSRKTRTNLDSIETPSIFPTGSIHFSEWANLVRAIRPIDTPDVDYVADQFRRFLASKGIPPAGPAIRRAFITFVQLRLR